MFRTFTLPLTALYADIFSLLVTNSFCDSRGNDLNVANAIIPDRVMQLDVRPADANSGNVTYRDNYASPGTAQQLTNMSKRSNRNTIDLRQYQFADATGGDAIVVEIESA